MSSRKRRDLVVVGLSIEFPEIDAIISIYLLRPKAAQHNITITETEEKQKTNNYNTLKLETIKQITQQMKPWYMHQFTTVFSNDFQICSLISKSGVAGSGL